MKGADYCVVVAISAVKRNFCCKAHTPHIHTVTPCCLPPPPLPQAVHRQTSQVGAAKVCEMAEDDELDNFMVEIDILTEMDHRHVVKLLDAYLQRKQLWVSGEPPFNSRSRTGFACRPADQVMREM